MLFIEMSSAGAAIRLFNRSNLYNGRIYCFLHFLLENILTNRHVRAIMIKLFGEKQLKYNARLCNGSTTDSDSVCLGSNPSRAANYYGGFLPP